MVDHSPRYTDEQIGDMRDRVQHIFVDYARVNDVRRELELRFVAGSRASREPPFSSARLTVLCAPSGTGKSSAINAFLSSDLLRAHPLGHKVLHVPLPPLCTIKTMTSDFLTALNDPLADRVSTAGRNSARIVKRLRELDYRLIVVDEVQHLRDADTNRVSSQLTDWLKVLLDQAGVPVVCAGLEETVWVLRSNVQLARRMTKVMKMTPMSWEDERARIEFRYFLRAFEGQLPFITEPSNLHSAGMAGMIFAATEGLVGRVSQLVTEALEISMLRTEGPDCITANDLASAYRGLGCSSINPFSGVEEPYDFGGPPVTNPKARPRRARKVLP